ncbi:adenosine kinase [Croceicoccus mobilis]|uniref:Adenosine kinase n=1 Tax=Croceicoccus mobilis TaxID=1703339 RepID=A0A916YT95_9SPHN|nr:adenosine kinase [Croceicoccus mobilis]GGD60504.1 adenosine kinase [Croceicoccus mobilis]
MTEPRFDVLAIGNAIVDVISTCDDAFLAENALEKGAMTLVDTEQAEALYAKMGPGREISGGSASNTCASLAALGSRCAFIGQVANDQLGSVFAHDIRAAGIHYATVAREGEPPSARCLILVTPDGQRTMNTFLGASQYLSATSIDPALVADAKVLYLEGYLWDPDEPRTAMQGAIECCREAGREVAFTLSDSFLLHRHGDDFRALIEGGQIDILFANEDEALALTGAEDVEGAIEWLAPKLPVLVVTRSEKGAIAVRGDERVEVEAQPVEKVIDTTGAGDSFAAGFLHGHVQGKPLKECLTLGAIAAAEVISHYGARPEANLSDLVREKMG